MAHRFPNCMDEEYGYSVLDQKAGKTLEGFIKPSEEHEANHWRDGDHLDVLSNGEEFGWFGMHGIVHRSLMVTKQEAVAGSARCSLHHRSQQ